MITRLPIFSLFVILSSCLLVACSDDDDHCSDSCVDNFLETYDFTKYTGQSLDGCLDFVTLFEYDGAEYFSWGNPCVDFAGPVMFDCEGNELCDVGGPCLSCENFCHEILREGESKGIVGIKDGDAVIRHDEVGRWHVATISGGLAGVTDNYERGEVIWDFDPEAGLLYVQNIYEGDNLSNGGFQTDTFEYSTYFSLLDQYHIVIEGVELGEMNVSDNRMTIVPECCDRFGYILQR